MAIRKEQTRHELANELDGKVSREDSGIRWLRPLREHRFGLRWWALKQGKRKQPGQGRSVDIQSAAELDYFAAKYAVNLRVVRALEAIGARGPLSALAVN